MRHMRVVAVFALAAGTISAIAIASPPTNFSGTALAVAKLEKIIQLNDDRIKFQTKDPTDASVVRLNFGAGGKSGWHHHPGMVLVQVTEGTVKVYDSSCAHITYGVGSANGSVFVEGSTVHQVTSDAGAVAFATAVVEKHSPPQFRVEDPVPFCAAT